MQEGANGSPVGGGGTRGGGRGGGEGWLVLATALDSSKMPRATMHALRRYLQVIFFLNKRNIVI